MIIDYLIMGLTLILGTLFIGFLIGLKKPVDSDKYFQAMFTGYRKSKLRWLWKTLVFGFEYIIGIIILFIINTAFYPADLIRKIIKYLFVSGTKNETKAPGTN
jgi:predicted membrane protein